jgi:hypothetical protein
VEGAEHLKRHESTFRHANERIQHAAHLNGYTGLVPFICECADERCTEIIRLSLADYEGVRSHPRRFVVAPGHDADRGGLVAARPRYAIVERSGHAGAVAEAEDRPSRPG